MDLSELFRTEADALEPLRVSLWQVVSREHTGVEHWLREHVPGDSWVGRGRGRESGTGLRITLDRRYLSRGMLWVTPLMT